VAIADIADRMLRASSRDFDVQSTHGARRDRHPDGAGSLHRGLPAATTRIAGSMAGTKCSTAGSSAGSACAANRLVGELPDRIGSIHSFGRDLAVRCGGVLWYYRGVVASSGSPHPNFADGRSR
jgi:hypothetical protein